MIWEAAKMWRQKMAAVVCGDLLGYPGSLDVFGKACLLYDLVIWEAE